MRTIYKFLDIMSTGNLHWGYPLINEVYWWPHECGAITFLENTFWCVTTYLKCEPLHELCSWRLDVINLVRGHDAICRPEHVFRTSHDL